MLKRIVIKLGSQVVANAADPASSRRLRNLVNQIASIHRGKAEILLVTSGAVALGRSALRMSQKLSTTEKQACAAVGQAELMHYYRRWFQSHKIISAQLLLTADDFSNRNRYLCLRATLQEMLGRRVIPIINENDPVSSEELKPIGLAGSTASSFGDNDRLSALVAAKLDADLLILVTDVDGIYTADPKTDPDAKRLTVVSDYRELQSVQSQGKSLLGRGGMTSKIEAAKIASVGGVHTMITSGLAKATLTNCVRAFGSGTPKEGKTHLKDWAGTWILPQSQAERPISKRKQWIGFSSGYRGVLTVNDGAKRALLERGASLLPSGIIAISGEFAPKDIVSLQDERGDEIGRGMVLMDSKSLTRVLGKRSQEIAEILGAQVTRPEAVHRDDLILFNEMK